MLFNKIINKIKKIIAWLKDPEFSFIAADQINRELTEKLYYPDYWGFYEWQQ
jgi:hypothetical protein